MDVLALSLEVLLRHGTLKLFDSDTALFSFLFLLLFRIFFALCFPLLLQSEVQLEGQYLREAFIEMFAAANLRILELVEDRKALTSEWLL